MVNNAVKHAVCSTVDVRLDVRGADLVLQVEDDGRGFVVGETEEGTGHASLRSRAARLGGSCEIRSRPGAGTCVTVRVPLQRAPVRSRAAAPP